jgi:hypothetical protein
MNALFGTAAGLLAAITLIMGLTFQATGHEQLAQVTLKLGGVPMGICFALWVITGMFGGGSGGGRKKLRKGKCAVCGQPTYGTTHCPQHASMMYAGKHHGH